jgi:type IV secretion system protein VirD4
VRALPDENSAVPVLVILDEFARLGRASVIASAFSYVAGYGIRLLPVIQSRSQLRGVYGEHVADEIVANCGVEVAFTLKELRVANDLSERIGYVGQESVTKSLTINGLLANRSKSISEQRRALMLPRNLCSFRKVDPDARYPPSGTRSHISAIVLQGPRVSATSRTGNPKTVH